MSASKPPAAGFAPLTTERLTLRPYCPDDAAELHRLINDWEVTRNLAAVPFPYSRALAEDWIRSAGESLAGGSAYHLVISGAEDGREIVVGGIGLRGGQRGGGTIDGVHVFTGCRQVQSEAAA